MLREYEAILVLKNLKNQEKQKGWEPIEKALSKRNISPKKKESWGVLKLFHPVKNEKKGEFHYFLFKARGEDISALQTELKLNINVLKCLITRVSYG